MLGNSVEFDTLGAEDATVATPATTPAPAAAQAKSQKMSEVQKIGQAVVDSFTTEQQATAKSAKDSLVFKGFAVLQSKQTASLARKDANGNTKRISAPKDVGLVFVSKVPITVPLISIKYDNFRNTVPENEISERTIPAGTQFILTKIETMYLLARLEYSGYFTTEDKGDASMSINTSKYQEKNALPTPTFNLANGAIHDMIVPIDVAIPTDPNDPKSPVKWTICDEPEAARFKVYLEPKTANRVAGSDTAPKAKADKPVIVAAALRQILGIKG